MARPNVSPPSEAADRASLRRRRPPRESIDWALRNCEPSGRVSSVIPLRGGISHANHLIRIDASGSVREVVLRRWVRDEWRTDDPEFSPAQEVATYDLLSSSPVPAPRLIAADVAGGECDVPAILITRAPGARLTRPPDMRFFLAQLAQALPLVHGIDPARARVTVPPYRPYYERERLSRPDWTRMPAAWDRAIALAIGPEPAEPAAFIHRDYHPGNTLWASGRLSAIVDWTTASWGSRGVDLAHMRANLALAFSVEAADAFLDAYRAVVGAAYRLDPWWDLRMAVDFLPDLGYGGWSAAELGRLDRFVARAVAAL